MSAVALTHGFASEHRTSLFVSAGLHLLLLFLLSSSLIIAPQVPQQLAIEAVLIDESLTRKAVEDAQRRRETEAQKRREEEARQAQAERERQEAQRRQETEAERRQQAEAERQRQEQLRVQQERQEAERKASEQARIEREQEAARQRAIEERKQREAAARAEEERQRLIAAAEQEEQQRREAEMLAAMEAEEALFAARQSGEMAQYIALIRQKVERNWVKPASAQAGLECEVAVVQLPNGDVVDVRTVRCNGDDTVRRSIENAVRRSSPLPLPENRVLFDRNLSFIFAPE
jgi:colicin import membrane protein